MILKTLKISKPAIARLAYKSGAKTLGKDLYDDVECMIKSDIRSIVSRAVIFAPRKVITSSDVKEVLRFLGRTVYSTGQEETMKKCNIHTNVSEKTEFYEHQHDCIYLPRSKFGRIVKATSGNNKKWSRNAMALLQCVVEDNIMKKIKYGVVSMIHRGKKTLKAQDMEMVRKLQSISI
jgi:histone H3/H4